MINNKEEYWAEHIAIWKESGLSRNAYCKKNDIYPSTLTNWIKKIEKKLKPVRIEIPLKTENVASVIIIETPELRITIPQSVTPDLVSSIIRNLKVCS